MWWEAGGLIILGNVHFSCFLRRCCIDCCWLGFLPGLCNTDDHGNADGVLSDVYFRHILVVGENVSHFMVFLFVTVVLLVGATRSVFLSAPG